MKIGIIGAGVVGTATGKGLSKLGHEVTFYDILKKKMLTLKQEGYQVCSSIKDIILNTDISFVCVNTPTNKDGQQDLSQVMSVLDMVTDVLNTTAGNRHRLIVFRSTTLPGTMKNVIIPYLEKNCSLERGTDYNICNNPEFLRISTSLDDFLNPDRVVIGEDKKGASYSSSLPLKQIYKQLTDNIIITDYDTAEMIKYASNCFLSLKISFFNEIGLICKELGIDDRQTSLAVSLDKRIGKYGTEAGRPFSGMCLPKDTQAFSNFVKGLKMKSDLLRVILDINQKVEELTKREQIINEIGSR
jgi:nucleotide sugar dehydrogenase